ncbi:MAG: OmpA family protein [Loktanella sp.]|nr:OmpA family protein [Loktanella sp.]
MKTYLIPALAAVTLAACGPSQGSFFTEAGSELDQGDFGNATANNTLIHTSPQNYTINLARRFAAEVDSTVNFEFDSAVLDAAAQATLRQQADWIRQFPEVRFKVFGHTDLVGSAEYNRNLGLRRAQAVVSFLASQGIGRDRLEAVVSFGQTQPLIPTPDPERRNRRTVTEVSGFVENNPMLLNGKYAAVIFREYIVSAEPSRAVADTVISTGAGG